MAATWIATRAPQGPEQGPETKVPLRENPLTMEDFSITSPPDAPSPLKSPTSDTSAKDLPSTTHGGGRKLIGHPARLHRSAVKAEVLKKYTTNQPIASFIDVEEGLSEDQRAKMRAERLGSTSEGSGQRVTGNSQVELVSHVEGLDKELRRFWKSGEKVRSTRVTIQAIKMLCNPKVPQCYPSIFMLVSSVMDTFGDFVAKRLQELSANGNAVVAQLLKKGQDADADLIPPETVEVCNNWFLKISSIRELVPRICVELSLLKCFRYVSKKMRAAMPDVVERLAGQIRGIADPLVASHIRWYLFLRAAEVLHGAEWATPLTQCYLDQLHMMQSVKYPGALALYAPSVQWMLDTLLAYGSTDDRERILAQTVENILSFNCAALSAVLFRALSFEDLQNIGFDNLLSHIGSFKEHSERATAVSALCLALVDGDVPGATRGAKTAFLSELHGVAELETLPIPQFMMVSEALLLLCAAHFGPKQIHVMLRLIRDKIADEPTSQIEEPLTDMFARVIRHYSPSALLTSPDLIPLVRMVSISGRGPIITNLLRAIPFGNEGFATVALELCRILEQCQSVVGGACGGEAYTTVVAKALAAVCPNDPEAKLSFLCEARHTLSDAEELRTALIYIALRTAETLSMTNRKRRNAAKVFFAFAHVTIPAIQSPFMRLKVALYATAVAFKKGLVSYGEGLVHLCVGILPDLEPVTTLTDGTVVANDAATRDIAFTLLSIAAVVPPHRKYGHLYLLESLLQWTDKYQWPMTSTARYSICLAVVRTCTRLLKGELLYSYPLCGSSNSLNDPQFVSAATDAALNAMKRCLHHINRLHSDSPQHPLLHDVCLEGFETVMLFAAAGKSTFCRCAGAFFWRVGKESMSGTISPEMERARSVAVARSSEQEVNEVVYYQYQKELVFEKFGCRLVTEAADAAVGNAQATTAGPSPQQAEVAATTSSHHVDPTAGGESDEADALAAAEAAVGTVEIDELEAAERGDDETLGAPPPAHDVEAEDDL